MYVNEGLSGSGGGGGGSSNSVTQYVAEDIDCTSTGTTTLVSSDSGKMFIPTTAPIIRLKSIAGLSGIVPTLSIGNDVDYNNLVGATTLTDLISKNKILNTSLRDSLEKTAIDISSTNISINVSTASTYDTYTIDVIMTGVEIDFTQSTTICSPGWDSYAGTSDGSVTDLITGHDTFYFDSARIDSERVFCAYFHSGVGIKAFVFKYDKDNDTVTIGKVITITTNNAAGEPGIRVQAKGNRVLVLFVNSTDSSYPHAIAVNVEDTSIDKYTSSSVRLTSNRTDTPAFDFLDRSSAILAMHHYTTLHTHFVTFSIADDTLAITVEDELEYSTDSGYYGNSIAHLANNRCIYAFEEEGGSDDDDIQTLIVDVTDDGDYTISTGDKHEIYTASGNHNSTRIVRIDDNNAAVVIRTAGKHGHAVVVNESSGTLSSGSTVQFNDSGNVDIPAYYFECDMSSDGNLLIAFEGGTATNSDIYVAILSISGTTLTMEYVAAKTSTNDNYRNCTFHDLCNNGVVLFHHDTDDKLKYRILSD